MTNAAELLSWLRAAGEPSRLRLLALCDRGELSVSDLAQALGQSEPRVCRHLRILSEAGLIERLRNGQWVHYRIATNVAAASFVKGLLAQLDRAEPVFERDLRRAMAESHGSPQAMPRTSQSRLGRALKDFVENNIPAAAEASRAVLVVGVEHLEILEAAACIGSGCTAIAHSRRAAQSARAFAERSGFNCRVLLAASSDALCERDLARAGLSFDLVILNHLAAANTDVAKLLDYGSRALVAGGSLCLFERYESLEAARGKVIEHPLARLRRLLGDVGLICERLSPIEADDEHVLAAVAVPSVVREQLRHA